VADGRRGAGSVCLDSWAVIAWLDGQEAATARVESLTRRSGNSEQIRVIARGSGVYR
jgi:hypothetical protein